MEDKDLAKELAKQAYSSAAVFNDKAFDKDFNVFITTKKMISRFIRTGKFNEKLLVNNIVTTLNVFGSKTSNQVYRLILNDVQFSVVKAILMFLRQYDYKISPDVYPNRIVVDVLRDMTLRYNLDHL